MVLSHPRKISTGPKKCKFCREWLDEPHANEDKSSSNCDRQGEEFINYSNDKTKEPKCENIIYATSNKKIDVSNLPCLACGSHIDIFHYKCNCCGNDDPFYFDQINKRKNSKCFTLETIFTIALFSVIICLYLSLGTGLLNWGMNETIVFCVIWTIRTIYLKLSFYFSIKKMYRKVKEKYKNQEDIEAWIKQVKMITPFWGEIIQPDK